MGLILFAALVAIVLIAVLASRSGTNASATGFVPPSPLITDSDPLSR